MGKQFFLGFYSRFAARVARKDFSAERQLTCLRPRCMHHIVTLLSCRRCYCVRLFHLIFFAASFFIFIFIFLGNNQYEHRSKYGLFSHFSFPPPPF